MDVLAAIGAGKSSISFEIAVWLTLIAFAPAMLAMTTAFTRIAIVLSFLRTALGANQMPPNQVMLGIALFLTFFVMAPVYHNIDQQAIKPYLARKITQAEALRRAEQPVRAFMFKQANTKDVALFMHLAKLRRPQAPVDVPTYVLIPAFITSELKTAFQIGFILYLPFLVIDIVVATLLMSMGMMMLPPTMISLPFKLVVFVLVDGWNLLNRALVMSFH